MTRSLLAGAAALLLVGTVSARFVRRWGEESQDRRLTLAVDWADLKPFTARQGIRDAELLERLQNSGANALLFSPSTIGDLAANDFLFSTRKAAETVANQLQARG